MAKSYSKSKAIDDVARLTSDLKITDSKEFERLQGLLAATVEKAPDKRLLSKSNRLAALKVEDTARERIRGAKLSKKDLSKPPLMAARVDERDDLLAARLATPLSALGGAERLGPYIVDDRPVFFDFWRAAKRFEVTEQGASAPAFVLSSARRPSFSRGDNLTLDVQSGTVWIRGDLIDKSLPAGAYAGITVSDGKLRLREVTDTGEGSVKIAAPVEAELELVLTAKEIAPEEGGCKADVQLKLPKLILKFGPGGLTVEGESGAARAWGQDFVFGEPTGNSLFVPQLWTLLLGYTVEPDRMDASAIPSKLADFKGEAAIESAALALPVVVAQPAALGPSTVAPGFWMALSGLMARWYAPDERLHSLDPWMAITNRGVGLLDVDVAPLAAAVDSTYRLWDLPQTDGKRVPWHHKYAEPFLFYYLCDVERGEALLATGQANVVLDRPVQANGKPVPTPTDTGIVFLQANHRGIRATLGAVARDSQDNQLVLRNALVWATRSMAVFTEGSLKDRQLIDDGSLLVYFGVYAWAPTLPDPYVGNFHICKPDIDDPRSLLGALVRWTTPAQVNVTFTGDIGLPIICPNDRSPGKPRPAPGSDLKPDVGQTQTEQGSVSLSKDDQGRVDQARAIEKRGRKGRVGKATQQNQASESAIEGELAERLGRTPPVFLLDVSTNQDLLGVALWGSAGRRFDNPTHATAAVAPTASTGFPVRDLDVNSPVEALRLVTLPQVQWEPVRTLDEDQDVLTLGWFPTPLASANDGGATVLGARSQRLSPVIPDDLLARTKEVFDDGTNVTFRTTLPFGIVTVASVNPSGNAGRQPDTYEITQPDFPTDQARGGLQITAKAEGGRDAKGGVSPYFDGRTRQMINGVELDTGDPLGLSVLSSTGDPAGDVETIFNNDMTQNPKVPVTRFDLSGYGGSNFSKWENPFALFAETAKTQFQVTMGRTALEIIKVASVLHPWGIKVTRSVIVERRSGGGVIRRDTGWQATSAGIFDYRYIDTQPNPDVPKVADYAFDAGIFEGLFNIRSIRPAPGIEFSNDGATFVPYYFDADLALDGMSGRTPANGILGWLQTVPSGQPASKQSLRALIEAQGPVGGPIDTWIDFGASKLPFRARRVEVGVVDDVGGPIFAATVRGVPKLPTTGAWSVVQRPLTGVPDGGGEAVPVSETKGVPIIRRYPVKYDPTKDEGYQKPRLEPGAPIGDWRMADPADLLTPATPDNEYCILQSAPTHAFLFPRPHARDSGPARLRSTETPALADIIARSTSKGAFPPPQNAIALPAPMHFDVGTSGTMALSDVVTVVNHPTPLRLAGEDGHGSVLTYEDSTLRLELAADRWDANFNGLTMWSDIAGLPRASGSRMQIHGSTEQRPQVAEIDTLVYEPVEKILSYIPVFGARDMLGPIDLGASNAKHEIKIDIATIQEVPKEGFPIGGGAEIKLLLGAGGSTGFDLASGGVKASGELTAGIKAEIPIVSVGAAKVYVIVQLDVQFSIASVVGVVTEEKLELIAFAGLGVKGNVGGFEAYAYLGVGFVFVYDFVTDTPKFGGLVRFEAGVTIVTSFKVCKVKLLAEFKGVVYKKAEPLPPPEVGTKDKTLCDYTGKVKLQVDIFLIISISATYTVSGTTTLE